MTFAKTLLLVLAFTGVARAAEPRLAVPVHKLAAALHCQPQVRNSRRVPIMLVTATGFTGSETWGKLGTAAALLRGGHPACFVDFPDYTTGDVQTAVQYLVFAIRAEARRARRPIAIFGLSQGALLPRWALTYWPSLRKLVSDVVAVAGTQHGTTWAGNQQLAAQLCSPDKGCPPAFWQQSVNSHLLKALNAQPDETPGPTSWTTVRSLTDDVVQPEYGPYPTSSLQGASNILVQAVCPGRKTTHFGMGSDSVSFAALFDAISHPGPARASRFPRHVCVHPFWSGLDPAKTQNFTGAAIAIASGRLLGGTYPPVKREPPVQPYAQPRYRTLCDSLRSRPASSSGKDGNTRLPRRAMSNWSGPGFKDT